MYTSKELMQGESSSPRVLEFTSIILDNLRNFLKVKAREVLTKIPMMLNTHNSQIVANLSKFRVWIQASPHVSAAPESTHPAILHDKWQFVTFNSAKHGWLLTGKKFRQHQEIQLLASRIMALSLLDTLSQSTHWQGRKGHRITADTSSKSQLIHCLDKARSRHI